MNSILYYFSFFLFFFYYWLIDWLIVTIVSSKSFVIRCLLVQGYRLKIHFDGWSSDYDFWTDDNWPDLHPTSWCSKSGHPLQPPLSSAEKEPSTNRCPTVGCEGIGHIEGAKFASHNTLENCPYYSLNLHRESPVYPDRLSGEDIDVILATDADETRRVKPATDAPKSSQAASDCGDPTPATLPASPPPPGLGNYFQLFWFESIEWISTISRQSMHYFELAVYEWNVLLTTNLLLESCLKTWSYALTFLKISEIVWCWGVNFVGLCVFNLNCLLDLRIIGS